MARTRDIDQEEEKGCPYCLVEDGGSKRHARLVPEKAGIVRVERGPGNPCEMEQAKTISITKRTNRAH